MTGPGWLVNSAPSHGIDELPQLDLHKSPDSQVPRHVPAGWCGELRSKSAHAAPPHLAIPTTCMLVVLLRGTRSRPRRENGKTKKHVDLYRFCHACGTKKHRATDPPKKIVKQLLFLLYCFYRVCGRIEKVDPP